MKYLPHIFGTLLVLAIIGLGVQYRTSNELAASLLATRDSLNQTIQQLAEAREDITNLEAMLADATAQLRDLGVEKTNLASELQGEKQRNDVFAEQIEEISGTVGVLDKLSKTDEELLQKYSRVYFLNENYVPDSLSKIAKTYLYDEGRTLYAHTKVEPFLERMLKDAKDDDVNIWITSAYRSFGEQAQLKNGYLKQYGDGSNTFSADQGYSEHQLGTTFDFTTTGLGGGLNGFENTAAYAWLEKNAYKYGFILSYPHANQFYEFEPWHWRFVGQDLADDLRDDKADFYDWDQREIDEYLVSIFD